MSLGPEIPPEFGGPFDLPDLASLMEKKPMEAFKAIRMYAENGFGNDYALSLIKTLTSKGEVITGGLRGPTMRWITVRQDFEVRDEAELILRDRFAPLLPIIEDYATRWRRDPATVNRLAWMVDWVEAIPGALAGEVWHPVEGYPNDVYPESRQGRWLLRDLRDGLLEIIDGLAARTPAQSSDASTEPTFLSLLGEANLRITRAALREIGIGVATASGKARVIAAMEVALEYFGATVPSAPEWPRMLNEEFPGINASVKARPPARTSDRTERYLTARRAMQDHLNK